MTVSGTGVEIGRETGAAHAKSVETNVRLNKAFSAAGPSGPAEQKVSIKDADLADAAGVASFGFNIRSGSPGSVLVAVNAPEKSAFFAQDIQQQSLDRNSKLGSGRFTEAPMASGSTHQLLTTHTTICVLILPPKNSPFTLPLTADRLQLTG